MHGKRHKKGPGGWVTFDAGATVKHGPFMPEGYDKKDVALPLKANPLAAKPSAVSTPPGRVPDSSLIKGKGPKMPGDWVDPPEMDAYKKKWGVGEGYTGFSEEDMQSMYGEGGGGNSEGDAALMAAIINLYASQAVDPRFR